MSLRRGCVAGSEVLQEVREGFETEEFLGRGGLVECLVFEHPGAVVRDEDGVDAGCECWVDVRFG